jgi:hypothetical protein
MLCLLIRQPFEVASNALFITGVPPNYALERSVRGFSERAAGAQTIIAPAAAGHASHGSHNADARGHN